MQSFSTIILAACQSKDELTKQVQESSVIKREGTAFVRNVKKNAMDLQKLATKAIAERLKAKADAVHVEAAAEQDEIRAALVPEASILPVPPKGDQLAIFGAQPDSIQDIVAISIEDIAHFNFDSINERLSNTICSQKNFPYAITSRALLKVMQEDPGTSAAFGTFMADFLGSAEYHSVVGRADSKLQGAGQVAEQMRKVVVMNESQMIDISDTLVKQCVANASQQGVSYDNEFV